MNRVRFLRHIWILLKKAFQVQCRHPVATFFELFLPAFFGSLLIIGRYYSDVEHISNTTTWDTFAPDRLPPMSFLHLCRYDDDGGLNKTMEIAYSPDSPAAGELMDEVLKSFNNPLPGRGYYLNCPPNDTVDFSPDMDDMMEYFSTFEPTEWRLTPFADEVALSDFIKNSEESDHIFMGVSFSPAWDVDSVPELLDYSIRPPAVPRQEVNSRGFRSAEGWRTNLLYPLRKNQPGPRSRSADTGGSPHYYSEGFLSLQHYINEEFLVNKGGTPLTNLKLKRFSFRPYPDDPLMPVLAGQLAFILLICTLYLSSGTAKTLAVEKETRLKEYMLMMGLGRNVLWFATWIFAFFKFLITATTFLIVLFAPFTEYGAVFIETNWLIFGIFLVSYGMSLISFGFLMGAIFKTSTSASISTGGITFLMFIPYRFIQIQSDNISFSVKSMLSLLPPVAMAFGCETVSNWELRGMGLQWNNFFTPLSATNPTNLGTTVGILLIDTALYFILGLYIDTIRPGQWGIPKPWNFFCRPSYWNPRKIEFEENSRNSNLEQPYTGTNKAGFSLRNVIKEFDTGKDCPLRAVDGLSIDAYQNEITVLLGPNGAGKSTTINMMSGMLVADKGTCSIGGFDIVNDPWKARSSLGLCPQHDILITELTVLEHLVFFAQLKGLTKRDAIKEAHLILPDIQLAEKKNIYSHKLSGGMKRKLSIGIAVCGKSSHLILDEPSSGIDVRARRELWKILEKYRKSHTMLLSTHYMDEAEQLADRIIIMARGSVQCSGTVVYLKDKLGNGYHLTMSMSGNTDVDQLGETIKAKCPGAYLEKIYGMEADYILPFSDAGNFSSLFEELEKSADMLGISSFGVSVTTMNEIFLKMTKTVDGIKATRSITSATDNRDILDKMTTKIKLLTGVALRLQQFRGSFIKCMYHSLRNFKTLATSLFFPSFFVGLAILVITFIPVIGEQDSLDLSFTPYTSIATENGLANVIVDKSSNFNDGVSRAFPTTTANVIEETWNGMAGWDQELSDLSVEELGRFENEYLVAFELNSSSQIAFYNNEAYHTIATALHYADLIALKQHSDDYDINARNHPLPPDAGRSISKGTSFSIQGFIVTFYSLMGFMIMYAQFSMLPVRERETGVKVMQKCSGAPLWVTWFACYCWDIINAVVPNICIIIILISAQSVEGIDVFAENAAALFFGIFIVSFSILPCTYCISFAFDNPAQATNVVGFINFGLGIITFITLTIIQGIPTITDETADLVDKIFSLFPQYIHARTTYLIYYNGNIKKVCESNSLTALACDGDGLSYVDNIFTTDDGGIGNYLLRSLGLVVLYFILLAIIEWNTGTMFIKRMWRKFVNLIICPCKRGRPVNELDADILPDSDVAERKKTIHEGVANHIKDHSLVINNLNKNYDGFHAVKGVSFMVKPNSCFGLLGPNGAGKTSCFKMLTGEESVSGGEAYINGKEIQKDRFGSLREFGYCPQFDALLQQLTGRETLRLYARLRGVPENQMNSMVQNLIALVGIKQYADQPASTYSGGNKRKLSVGIALTGYPKVAILDEPSCGLDPGAKRQLWSVILSVMKTGATVLLTTHSMEETSALCDELAIMVNGELKCIGGQQHLKSKFGKGVEIEVQLHETTTGEDVVTKLCKKMPFLVVEDTNPSFISFRADTGVLLSAIFKELEASKAANLISGYTVDQPTIEHIFMDLTNDG